MRTRNLLLASLLVALYGCQPETPAQKSAAPAAETAAAPAPAEPAAPAAMTPAPAAAPVKAAAPAPAEKAAPAAQEKPATVKKETAKPATPSTTAPASVPPAAKAEPVPAPAAVKPEVPPVAAVSEADGLALAKKNNCMACHAIDKKVVGPAWKDVAAKYRGDVGAEARLMDKIAKGGSGAWGSMAMPANPKISEADRRALARFVLSLK
ncbi:hypothetical protein FGKAn22_21430 [Ferrigenium kumadai]|uniref:Cytochrome c domain-containing protein n=1 Tax=Ferrigenium kumadai TaxID=1682490 RepID=A0AAN1T0G0_9PROT|nr:c-type cytochrome [Ferrigenium kumadai]BBJ00451.1 hypothetical protein FGKAn22_21430 [Ferrigenium kumadai]